MARLLDEDAAAVAELRGEAGASRRRPSRPQPAEAAPAEAAPASRRAPSRPAARSSLSRSRSRGRTGASPAAAQRRPPPPQPTPASSRGSRGARGEQPRRSRSRRAEPRRELPRPPRRAAAKPAAQQTPTKQWVVKRAAARPAPRPRSSGRARRGDDLAQPRPARSDACVGPARTLVRPGARGRHRSVTTPTGPPCSACSGRKGSAARCPRRRRAQHARLAARRRGRVEGRARALRPDGLRRPRRPHSPTLPVGRDRGARDRLPGREGAARRAAARRRAGCGSTAPDARTSRPGGSTSG